MAARWTDPIWELRFIRPLLQPTDERRRTGSHYTPRSLTAPIVQHALEPAFGGIVVLPVHGRQGQPAIRVIVRASKGARAPLAVMPGLLLNDAAGKPTAEAEEILRDAQPLKLGG